MEEWKDISGYEGLYQISNYGNVRAINYNHTGRTKDMRLCNSSFGYSQICLTKNNHKSTKKVHRLVAEAFIPNPNNYKAVNHKDENKKNNHVDNLEWCSAKYNNNYGTRIARTSREYYQLDLDGKLISVWKSGKEIERELGFDRRHINRCCAGGIPTAYGYKWKKAADVGRHIEIK